MPIVTFHHEHRAVEADSGSNLRRVMRSVGVSPYRGLALVTNCRGHNFCGTCAVEVVDGKGAAARGKDEENTLSGNLLIARTFGSTIRLSCQTTITGDMTVKTHPARPADRYATRQRLVLAGIASFFLLAFLGTFAYLFLDMIRVF